LKQKKNKMMQKIKTISKSRCAFAQIAIKDFENTENRKFSVCSFSGENFA